MDSCTGAIWQTQRPGNASTPFAERQTESGQPAVIRPRRPASSQLQPSALAAFGRIGNRLSAPVPAEGCQVRIQAANEMATFK
jgi:hypothetical protein